MITDGRDEYLKRCVESAENMLHPRWERFEELWMYDDTGDEDYRRRLREAYPQWRHINGGPRQGCAGAIASAWNELRERSQAKFIFHLEQDFVFTRRVVVDSMARILRRHKYIAQIALIRQPCNPFERQHGGLIESHPDWYTLKHGEMSPYSGVDGLSWLEHRSFFTCNPCLYRRDLLTLGWPEHRDGRYSEDTFHRRLLTEGIPGIPGEDVRYAYFTGVAPTEVLFGDGGDGDTGWMSRPWVEHIGDARHTDGRGY